MGRDAGCEVEKAEIKSFNPRARMGRDANRSLSCVSTYVSIHAPAWGATKSVFPPFVTPLMFQSTRPHGARLLSTLPMLVV